MGRSNKEILDMIIQNKSINQICEETGLTYRQLSYRIGLLKNNGYNISRKYYYNGNSIWYLKNIIDKESPFNILTNKNDQSFEALLISDLHIGSEKERIDALDKIYNYCIENNIHIIINCGDLLDGIGIKYDRPYKNFQSQFQHFMKIYPFDKNILNFICLGNHDYKFLTENYIDLKDLILNKRQDIIPIGYGVGKINVQNDQIIVRHSIDDIKMPNIDKRCKIVLNGHTHRTRIEYDHKINNLFVFLPSLSDIKFKNEVILPGAFKMKLNLINGNFSLGLFEQLLIGDKIYKIGEFQYDLHAYKQNYEKIKNIEDEIEEKQKVLQI